MIKTLRITGILSGIVGIGLLLLVVVMGGKGEAISDDLFDEPTVVEAFKQASSGAKSSSDKSIAPLVQEAHDFGLYLNPPKPKVRPQAKQPSKPETKKEKAKPDIPRPSGPVTSKFDVVATSHCESNPEFSLALIDEPGKGRRWVRLSSQVGHLVIDDIRDGFVVIRDGSRTFEQEVVKRAKLRSLLADSSSTNDETRESSSRERGPIYVRKPSRPKISPEEMSQKMEKMIEKMNEMQKGIERRKSEFPERDKKPEFPGKSKYAEEDKKPEFPADYPRRGPANPEVMKKFMEGIRQMQVGTEETKNLKDLAEKLRKSQRDANTIKDRSGKLESSDND